MKNKKIQLPLILAIVCFALFVAEIILLCTVDVRKIGPFESAVGLATFNNNIFSKLGQSNLWYKVTEFLGYLPILTALGFAALGAYRLIKTKKLSGIGDDVIALGIVFILVAAFYVLFEIAVINHRPILIDGELEASFPSSHTMLAVSVLGCAGEYFFNSKLKNAVRFILHALFNTVLILTVVGRLLSGVHWFTDIVGGVLLGFALIFTYKVLSQITIFKKK